MFAIPCHAIRSCCFSIFLVLLFFCGCLHLYDNLKLFTILVVNLLHIAFITPSSSRCICHLVLFAHFDAPLIRERAAKQLASYTKTRWYILVSSTCYFNFPLALLSSVFSTSIFFSLLLTFASSFFWDFISRSADIRTDTTISDIK